jgi:antitoxin component YwqK of YwqJK toxin-antitoxin module
MDLKGNSIYNANGTEIVKLYHRSGAILAETPYKNGKRNGIDKNFYESGSLWYDIPYVDGNKHGIEHIYYTSGSIMCEIPYKYGIKHGVEKYYDKYNSNILSATLYDNGKQVLSMGLDGKGWKTTVKGTFIDTTEA